MFAVLFLPNFRLQTALRWREELAANPVVIVDDRSHQGIVLEANKPAEASGVRAGLASVQALARCSALTILPGNPSEEEASQEILLTLAHSLSPEVENTAQGQATLNLKGIKIESWEVWCKAAIRIFEQQNFACKIGVAPNPDLAFLAAKKAEPYLVVHAPEAFLRDLAVSSLEANPPLQAVLHDWGIHTLGQLTSLPRGELANRLGPEAEQLWRRAAGKTERLLRSERPVQEYKEAFDFECEIETIEPLLFILRRFLNYLCQRLELAHRVAAKIILTLLLENDRIHRREFHIPVPTSDEATLFRMVHTHLEGLELEERICGIRLLIEPILPEHQQFRLFDAPLRDAHRFAETLARLAALVGSDKVGIAAVADSHRADSISLLAPSFNQAKDLTLTKCYRPVGLPLKRFRPPFPAQIHLIHHQPVQVVSDKVQGRIIEALGPYRASGNWWDDAAWHAEEWDVEIAGEGLYRLHRQQDDWRIEGCYDA